MTGLETEAWNNLFNERVLKRGEEVFQSGRITDIRKTADGYAATARGTHRYIVEIETDGKQIKDMSCTCPYANEHDTCKHMAGLLFALTEGDAEIEPEPSETIEDIVNRMSEGQLREELLHVVKKDAILAARLMTVYREAKPDRNDAERIGRALDALAYEYGDRYGYIDWSGGSDYVKAFCSMMEEMVQPLIDRKAYDIAFQAVCKAFTVLNNVDMDGSDGEHNAIAETIEGYWYTIIHLASPEERDKFHDWFEKTEEKSDDLLCGESISNVLQNSFDDPKYIEPMLEEVREKLNHQLEDSWETEYLLKEMRDLLKRSGRDDTEFEDWLEAHPDEEAVKEIRLEQAEARSDLPAIISILEDLLSDGIRSWYYREKLLAAYRGANETEKEAELLRVILFEDNREDIGYLRRLRELTDPADWAITREYYLSEHPSLKHEIYAEEKLYDRLLESVLKGNIGLLDRYRDLLKDRYPEELRQRYLKYLESLPREHPCRSLYERMEKYLLVTASISGSIPHVNLLIERWRSGYPTRTKMQETLDRAEQKIRASDA